MPGFENLNKKLFLVSIQKWPRNALFWFFFTCFWIFVRQRKIVITQPIFKIFAIFFSTWNSLCGNHICFWYHSNPTWNDRDMAKIRSAGVFAPPLNHQLRTSPWIGLKFNLECLRYGQNCHILFSNGLSGKLAGG